MSNCFICSGLGFGAPWALVFVITFCYNWSTRIRTRTRIQETHGGKYALISHFKAVFTAFCALVV